MTQKIKVYCSFWTDTIWVIRSPFIPDLFLILDCVNSFAVLSLKYPDIVSFIRLKLGI